MWASPALLLVVVLAVGPATSASYRAVGWYVLTALACTQTTFQSAPFTLHSV